MFRIGQKVVCVKVGRGASWAERNGIADAAVGETYTIRGMLIGSDGEPGVWLQEIHNKIHKSGVEYGFLAHRFRPIVERKTDISVFTEMLKPKKRRMRQPLEAE